MVLVRGYAVERARARGRGHAVERERARARGRGHAVERERGREGEDIRSRGRGRDHAVDMASMKTCGRQGKGENMRVSERGHAIERAKTAIERARARACRWEGGGHDVEGGRRACSR